MAKSKLQLAMLRQWSLFTENQYTILLNENSTASRIAVQTNKLTMIRMMAQSCVSNDPCPVRAEQLVI